MYIKSARIVSQLGSASGHIATVLVEWEYGDQSVSVVEIAPTEDGVVNVPVTNKVPNSRAVRVPAGTQVTIECSPRLVASDGTFLQDMPDDDGVDQDFQLFKVQAAPFTTVDFEVPPPPPPVVDPHPVLDAPPPAISLKAEVVSFSHIRLTWRVGVINGFIRVHRLTGPSHVEEQNFKLDVFKRDFVLDDRGLSPLTTYTYLVDTCFGDDHNFRCSVAQTGNITTPQRPGLRAFLQAHGFDPSAGIRSLRPGVAVSIRNLMQELDF